MMILLAMPYIYAHALWHEVPQSCACSYVATGEVVAQVKPACIAS